MKKVLFYSYGPSPYRTNFYNLLGHYFDLYVMYETNINNQKHRDKNWFSKSEFHREIMLPSFKILGKSINYNIVKNIKKIKPEIIVMCQYSSISAMFLILYFKLMGIKYIFEVDGGYIKKENRFKYALKKFFISQADLYISSSVQADKYLIYYGANKNRIMRYNFTSLNKCDFFQKQSLDNRKIKDKFTINENQVILSIGQFINRKGFDWMIESYKKLSKDIGIYIVGGKPTKEYLDLKEKYNMTNLHFLGFKSKKEILELYSVADLFVLPTREDIWGLVINEALSCSVPVITTNMCVAGLELIKEGYNGYLVEVENCNQLLEKTENFFRLSDNEINKMKNNCFNSIKEYTIENMVERHIEIFSRYKKGDLL